MKRENRQLLVARLVALKERVAELAGGGPALLPRIGVFRIVGRGRFTLEGDGRWTGVDTAIVFYLNRVFDPRVSNGAEPGSLWMRSFDAAVRRFNGIVVYREPPKKSPAKMVR